MIDFFKTNIGKYASEMSPSPLGRWLNGKLIAVEEDSLSVEFVVREEMTNPLGILHGGVSASMMDDLVGMTIFSLGKKNPYVTVNLSVDYLRSAKIGDVIVAKSQVVRSGDSIVNMSCQLLNADGKILSHCTTNMVKIERL